MQKRGLGKGLAALLPDSPPDQGDKVIQVEIDRISTNPDQPRQNFNDESIKELAASIREHGVVQPVIIRLHSNGYQLVAGERRLRACREAGLTVIPSILRDLTDTQALEIALIENLQREDLNPMEEAEAYRKLTGEFGLSQEDVARRVGKSRPQITNTLRLLHLGAEVQSLLRAGRIAMGHARALLSLDNPAVQKTAAERIVSKGMSVREAEAHVSALVGRSHRSVERRGSKKRDADIEELESRLRSTLGTKVKLSGDQRRGKLEIHYFNAEELERVVSAILALEGQRAAQQRNKVESA